MWLFLSVSDCCEWRGRNSFAFEDVLKPPLYPHLSLTQRHDISLKTNKAIPLWLTAMQNWRKTNVSVGVTGEKSAKLFKTECQLLHCFYTETSIALMQRQTEIRSPCHPCAWEMKACPSVCPVSQPGPFGWEQCDLSGPHRAWRMGDTQRHRVLCVTTSYKDSYFREEEHPSHTIQRLPYISPPWHPPPTHININFFFLPHPNNYLLCRGFTVTLQLKATCINPTPAVQELIIRILNLLPINSF